ncbi:adenylate/guanylate cyclase domain-containing protein [Oceanibacterium hippocampi]|uniref:Adenylate cyclase 1 n=1 Tax=Oceanibacterium hippocampi TaxID=745714 RepID=A0A1Y5RUM1_9PROT|nr:adenylate/guanylate cyclase domain-containing protein [Oceanibacterium hippocampi]SLN25875.1 Adenylate cyclase 1 [Oceanibacterium hippocampi]
MRSRPRKPDSAEAGGPRKRITRLSIASALALALGLLTLTAVASVLAVGLYTSFSNTRDLGQDVARLAVQSAVDSIENHLDPIEAQLGYLAELTYVGAVDPTDDRDLRRTIRAALSATPDVAAAGFVDTNLRLRYIVRENGQFGSEDLAADPIAIAMLEAISRNASPLWGPVIFEPDTGKPIVWFVQPVNRDGRLIGAYLAVVPTTAFTTFLGASKALPGGTSFILYDDHYVLAHKDLPAALATLGPDRPLPPLAEFSDPVLREMWNPENPKLGFIANISEVQGHRTRSRPGEGHFFLYRTLYGYSDKPWQVGVYYRDDQIGAEFNRLIASTVTGFVILLLAIAAAILLGRRIARPIEALARAASQISRLDFARVTPLPHTRFRELNNAADAYNSMLRGLIWFERYVPKRLVERLVATGPEDSEEREVTVMFTDIVGFTRLAEGLSASRVASLLNRHFETITACIEAEDGTVDKFIGDSVMAFWGAPEAQPDHALRACRAAQAIAAGAEAENVRRRRDGEPPIRLRIGLHSGRVVVGNIGAPGRINYTVVSDTVNVAQRLEALGREIDDTNDCIVLASGDTREAARALDWQTVGDRDIRGRSGRIDVYRLRGLRSATSRT